MPRLKPALAWGRGPLVVAGIAIASLLGALASLVFGALAREQLAGLAVAAVLVVLALAALAVLAALLTLDRFPRTVGERLDALEARLARVEAEPGAAVEAAAAALPTPPDGPPARREPPPAVPSPRIVPEAAAPATSPPPPAGPAPATPGPRAHGARPAASLELLLGGRALAIAGALVLVVAVALLVKYGWDRGWFRPSPAQRVAIGVGIGMALLALGEAARRVRRYGVLAQVLTAGGVGALYVSAWAAHGLYRLVPAAAAFLLLAAAAAVGVAVATATRGRVVALLATVGGLLVPWLVELGPRPPSSLYAYLLVLLLAVLVVASARRWPELGATALVGTAALTAAAFGWRWPEPDGVYLDAGFLLAAMALFFAISLVSAWRRRCAPGAVELAVLASASLGGWAAGLARLEPQGTAVAGAWTVAVLLVELIAAHVLLVRLGAAAQGRRLFLGLALLLLTALPPVLWDGAGVAAAWAVEAVILLLAVRTAAGGHAAAVVAVMAAAAAAGAAREALGSAEPVAWDGLLRLGAAAVLAACLLLVELRRARGHEVAVSLAVAAAPVAAAAALAWAAPAIDGWAAALAAPRMAAGVAAMGTGLALGLLGALLLGSWPWRPLPSTFATGAALVAASLLPHGGIDSLEGWRGAAAAAPLPLAGAAVAALAFRVRGRNRGLESWAVAAGSAAVAAASAFRLAAGWPGDDVVVAGVAPGGLGVVAAALLLAAGPLGRGWLSAVAARASEVAGWVVALAAASRVLASAVALAGGAPELDSSRHLAIVALSVLWGAAGLASVLAGLVGRAAHRRHLGLAVLALTLVKVFLVDLASAPTVLRIVAFLATGLALLAGAFLYARFRERLEAGA